MTPTPATYRTKNSKPFVLFGLQVLCEVSPSVDFPTNFNNSVILSGFAVSSTAMIPKNPLRLIVARTPIFYALYGEGTEQLCWFLDTLECGHQQMTLNLDVPDIGKTRHRCGECAAAAALKKPAASAPAPKITRRAA